jgi:hypothetical protein
MPLHQLVPHLRRIVHAEPSTPSFTTRTFHAALDEIILTSIWCTYKHHTLLLEAEDGSNADVERSMMEWKLEKMSLGEEGDSGLRPLDKRKLQTETEKRECVCLLSFTCRGPNTI